MTSRIPRDIIHIQALLGCDHLWWSPVFLGLNYVDCVSNGELTTVIIQFDLVRCIMTSSINAIWTSNCVCHVFIIFNDNAPPVNVVKFHYILLVCAFTMRSYRGQIMVWRLDPTSACLLFISIVWTNVSDYKICNYVSNYCSFRHVCNSNEKMQSQIIRRSHALWHTWMCLWTWKSFIPLIVLYPFHHQTITVYC